MSMLWSAGEPTSIQQFREASSGGSDRKENISSFGEHSAQIPSQGML